MIFILITLSIIKNLSAEAKRFLTFKISSPELEVKLKRSKDLSVFSLTSVAKEVVTIRPCELNCSTWNECCVLNRSTCIPYEIVFFKSSFNICLCLCCEVVTCIFSSNTSLECLCVNNITNCRAYLEASECEVNCSTEILSIYKILALECKTYWYIESCKIKLCLQ